MRRWLFALSVVGLLVGAGSVADAATITICASGCTDVNANLQARIDALAPGDTLLLQQGFDYVKASTSYTFPVIACAPNDATCFVTIRTGVSATGAILSTSLFPPANIRINGPAYASVLAKLSNSSNNVSAIKVANGAHWYKFQWLEVKANTYGGNALMAVGTDTLALRSDIPHHITVDQVYFHGLPVTGQFRGVEWHANNGVFTNNYVSDIKSLNEGQTFWCGGFEGPLTVSNNYFEGGAETFLCGGSGGGALHTRTVQASPAPTTTTARLDSVVDLVVGQDASVNVTVSGTPAEAAITITAINGNDVTWTPILDVAPDVPGGFDYGLTPTNLTVTKNYFTRRLAWRDPIMGTPQSVQRSVIETGGTLAAGTYGYRVVARGLTTEALMARSTASNEITATIAGTTGKVDLTWAAVTNATEYYVYAGNVGAETRRFVVTAPTTAFTDTGAAGTTENVPTSTGTVWQAKNVFELKNVKTILVEGNIFENVWKQAQTGDAILFTAANTGCINDSTTVTDVTFRNNIVRHAAGAMVVYGRGVGACPTGRNTGTTITNNLFYDIDKSWGSPERLLYIAAGSPSPEIYHDLDTDPNTIDVSNLTFEHNTADNTSGQSMLYLDQRKLSVDRKNPNMIVRNNIGLKADWGLTGAGACIQGNDCWTRFTTGSTWLHNVTANATASAYPGGITENFTPTSAVLQSYYTNYAAQDFRLLATSPYHNAATDGTDLGANIPAILAFTNIAASGDNTGTPPPAPPVITTASLPDGTVITAYGQALAATGCGTGCTWSLVSGALPTGFDALTTGGVIAGVTAVPGVFTFEVKALASTGASSQRTFDITIVDAQTNDNTNTRPTRVNFQENGSFRRPDQPALGDPALVDAQTNTTLRTGDIWIDLTAGVFKWLWATSPTPVWAEFVQKVSGSAITSIGASGTPSATTYLRGDNSWAVPATSGVPFINLTFIVAPTGAQSWSAGNNAITEYSGSTRNRIPFDLTGYTQCRAYTRLSTLGAGMTSSGVYPQYSTDSGGTWIDLWGTSPSLDLMVASGNGVTLTAFTSIAAGAKTDVLLRMVANTVGTVTTQPTVGNTGINCK